MIETSHYTVDSLRQRQNGIYYTPPLAAQAMAEWVMRSGTACRILEPCFGSGVFLRAIKERTLAEDSVQAYGVELMQPAYRAAVTTEIIGAQNAVLGDFLAVSPFPVDAVIGNPPYVRLRSLPEDQQRQALSATEAALGAPMDTSGSVWMAFVIHATRFLTDGGKMALVLPYEFTHVRYARLLWELLRRSFGSLRIARVKERLFPDLMQEAIVLFADNRGATTNAVAFEAYATTRDLTEDRPSIRKTFRIRDIIHGRPFVKALLPDDLTQLIERLNPLTAEVPEACTFNIGYVSGDRKFFHPDKQAIAEFELPQTSLRNTLTASRDLSGAGLYTASLSTDKLSQLFYPNGHLSPADERYIHMGELSGVDSGYKCSHRDPWYKVPDVRVPDL